MDRRRNHHPKLQVDRTVSISLVNGGIRMGHTLSKLPPVTVKSSQEALSLGPLNCFVLGFFPKGKADSASCATTDPKEKTPQNQQEIWCWKREGPPLWAWNDYKNYDASCSVKEVLLIKTMATLYSHHSISFVSVIPYIFWHLTTHTCFTLFQPFKIFSSFKRWVLWLLVSLKLLVFKLFSILWYLKL